MIPQDPPARIWLQRPEDDELFDWREDATWCEDKINDTDVEYVRHQAERLAKKPLFWPGHGAILGAICAELLDDPQNAEDEAYQRGVSDACDAAAKEMDDLLARSTSTSSGLSANSRSDDKGERNV